LRLLRRLGIQHLSDLLPPDAYQSCTSNASAWGSEQWTYQDALHNPEGGGWHLLRHRFDAALRQRAQAAGAALLVGKMGGVNARRDSAAGWEIEVKSTVNQPVSRLTATWLVDATGRSAAVSRQLRVPRQRMSPQMAAVGWLSNDTSDADHSTRIKSTPAGWWYSAQLPAGHRVLAFHGLPEEVANLSRQPVQFLQSAVAAGVIPNNTHHDTLLQIKTTDASVARLERASGPHWLAVGDAALSFDPLSSQGIFFALYSGIRGAEALLEGSDAALQAYEARIQDVFSANQRSRKYFYHSELRWMNAPYWAAHRAG
jgi:flavin-dependent dehydrogenase